MFDFLIIIPAYNEEKFIAKTLDSLVQQSATYAQNVAYYIYFGESFLLERETNNGYIIILPYHMSRKL